MTHPLQNRIRSLGRMARRLTVIRGLSWAICVIGSVASLLALADFGLYVTLGLDDEGVRFVFAGIVLVIVAAALYFKVWPLLRHRWSDLQIARRIEQRLPFMRDRLSSAIDFLEQEVEDETAGSYALRRSVIAEAEARIDSLNLNRLLRFRPSVVFALAAVLVVGGMAGSLAGSRPARLAAQRLAMPWSHAPWPKRNNLRFKEPPPRMVAGEDLELLVVDANQRLPEAVELEYRIVGSGRTQQKLMKEVNGTMVGRIENVTQSLEYRATGGDDHSMDWRVVEVVEAPSIAEMQVTLHPPKYTGWADTPSGKDIRALQGTRIEISGRVSKPLRKMALRLVTSEGEQTLPVKLAADNQSFSFPASPSQPWLVDAGGKYWLEMTDEYGLTGGANRQWQVQPVPDQPPNVTLEVPQSNVHVTARAVVPLSALVKDDLAIKSVDLRFIQPNKTEQGEQVIGIYSRPERVPAVDRDQTNETRPSESLAIDYEWDLATVTDLQPGQTMDFFLAASDYKPQLGLSARRHLVVLDDADFEDRIGQRQSYVLHQLAEALRLQQEARSQITAMEIQLGETGKMQKQDIDALQSAELNQRQVQRLLNGEDGVEPQIVALLAELEISRIDSPDVRRRMSSLLAEVRRIQHEHLTVVQREMINSLKIARAILSDELDGANDASFDGVNPPLTTVGQQQDQVIEALQRLLGEYREWDNFRRFARDLRRMHRKQEDIRARTGQLSGEMIGKRADDLTPQERAELKMLAQQQLELSRQFDAVRSRMQQMQREVADQDPLVSRTLADAVDAALSNAISGQMREVGKDIENNRRGHAIQLQEDVAEGLKDLTDILANRREQELERLVEKLHESAAELEGLRSGQAAVRAEAEAAGNNPNEEERRRELQRLTRQQEQLAEQAERLSRKLQRLRAESASQSTQQAGASMRKSGDAAGQGDSSSAADQAKLAEERLADAQRKLQQAIGQAEQELYQERLVQLKQQIEGLANRQQNVVDEIARLEELRQAAGSFTPQQSASVRSISREQRALATEAGGLADEVSDAEAFALGLRGAVRAMLRAARGLDQTETGSETLQSAHIALGRLQQLIEALKTEDGEPPEDAESPPSEEGDQGAGDAIQLLAQLKLLKLMQEEINRRTAELEEAIRRRGGAVSPEQQSELDELASEQGKLADLLFNLSQPAEENPEDNPDSLPDVRDTEGGGNSDLDAELEKALGGNELEEQ